MTLNKEMIEIFVEVSAHLAGLEIGVESFLEGEASSSHHSNGRAAAGTQAGTCLSRFPATQSDGDSECLS